MVVSRIRYVEVWSNFYADTEELQEIIDRTIEETWKDIYEKKEKDVTYDSDKVRLETEFVNDMQGKPKRVLKFYFTWRQLLRFDVNLRN